MSRWARGFRILRRLAPFVIAFARDEPHFKFPAHVVHPEHGKLMTFDVRCEAVCPDVRDALAGEAG